VSGSARATTLCRRTLAYARMSLQSMRQAAESSCICSVGVPKVTGVSKRTTKADANVSFEITAVRRPF
jgi:hypothetical protein